MSKNCIQPALNMERKNRLGTRHFYKENAMERKKRSIVLAAVLAILTMSLTGFAIAQERKETVSIADKTGIGRYLVDSGGHALYYFKNDSPGKSVCFGSCAQTWGIY